MSYVIEVSSGQGARAVAMGTRTIVADRATIGRGAECSVAIEDPHKYVSRLHAILDTDNGECVLSVVSKVNPVMVNGTRIGPGVKAKVKTGDVLVIGEFKLIMRDVSPTAAPTHAAPSYAAPEKPKPQTEEPSGSKAEAEELLKELRRRVKPAVEEQAARVPAEPSPRPSVVKPPPPPPPAEEDEDLAEPTFVGKLEDLQRLVKAPAAPPPASPAPPEDEDLAEPTFVGTAEDLQRLEPSKPVPAPPPPTPAEPDEAIFNEPTFVGERPKELIGVSLLKQYSDDSGGAKEPGGTEKPEVPEKSEIDFEIFDEPTFAGHRPAEISALAPATPEAPAAPAVDDGIFNEPTFTGPRPAEFAALALGATDVAPAPAPAAAPPAPAEAPAAVPADVHALVEAFLEGAGMRRLKVSDEDAATFMRDSGAIVRAAIDGLVALLLARSEMKKEMRTEERTMVASRNNNPLKLVTNPEEAITYLFDSGERTGGFLQPVQAVNDACDDLRAHEIALMAGMRAALIGSIKRLEPQLLEAEYDKKGGISLNRKAKLWDLFVEMHAKLTSAAEDDFLKVFGREFLGTYEEQVKRLKSER